MAKMRSTNCCASVVREQSELYKVVQQNEIDPFNSERRRMIPVLVRMIKVRRNMLRCK